MELDQALVHMIEVMLKDPGMQALANEASRILERPLWLTDLNYHFLTDPGAVYPVSEELVEGYRFGRLGKERLVYLHNKNITELVNTHEGPYVYFDESLGNTLAVTAVRIRDVLVAHLVVSETDTPIGEFDIAFLNRLKDIMSLDIQRHSPALQGSRGAGEQGSRSVSSLVMSELLERECSTMEHVYNRLEAAKYAINRNLRLVVICHIDEEIDDFPWSTISEQMALVFQQSLYLRLYRIGYFRVHPIRRRAVALLRGKERCPDVLMAIIHNETDHYFSSFSMIPTRSKHMDLCAYDWERDVQAYQHLTLEGQALLLEQVQLVIYAVTATTPEKARERLKNIVALAYRRGELRPQVRLMVILVSDTPYSVEIPQDFYISQLDPKIVRRPEDVSLEELAVQRYRSVRQRNSGSHAQPQTDLQALIRMDQNLSIRGLCLSANSIYSQSPYLLMNFLAQQEWEVERWDPLLVEFFRGSVQMTSCLSSLIALMNLIDMFLRLALYTLLMSRDEHPSPNKRNVPDNYSELGASIFHAVRENDAVYYGVREQTEPCRLPAVLWGIGELLQADLRGDSFSCTGLCSALSYMRNKTKGHGVIREENAGLLWAFVLESVFTLGRMLCLDRFSIRREPDQVLAGWDGRLVNLGEFAIPAGNHPILMFDSKKEKQPVLIDYFHGSLVVPAIGQGPEVVTRISVSAQ